MTDQTNPPNASSLSRRLAWIAVITALALIMLGAYVRLSHAGLGCPDWPVCYGQITWPDAHHEIAAANAQFERPVEVPKAWKEQVHRHLALVLGLLILSLAIILNQGSWQRWVAIGSALLAALGVGLYLAKLSALAAALSAPAVLLPMLIAIFATGPRRGARLALFLLGLVIFQAMLGMWTVTWKLLPLVVTAHLLGGMASMALLGWLALSLRDNPRRALAVGRPAVVAAMVLLIGQIFLGGWTSTNYAALACPDFPQCNRSMDSPWWPQMDFADGFTIAREIGVDYEGGVLDAYGRMAIHTAHRLGALVLSIYLLGLALLLLARRDTAMGAALLGLLAIQVSLGILNVVMRLPLPVAVLHNGVAALLLFKLVMLTYRAGPIDPLPHGQQPR